MKKHLLAALCLLGGAGVGQAQILLTEFHQPVTQDFDTLGTSNQAVLPDGWKVDNDQAIRTIGTWSAAGTKTTRRGGNASTTTFSNGIFNFGAGDAFTATDRALGFYTNTSGTLSGNLYAHFKNETGADITSLAIAYDIEKYKSGLAEYRFDLYFSLDGVSWSPVGGTFVNHFQDDTANSGFEQPPGATLAVSGTFNLSSAIAAGEEFYLNWNFSVASGSNPSGAPAHAIDNVSITAIPEPSPVVLLGALGGLLLLGSQARRFLHPVC